MLTALKWLFYLIAAIALTVVGGSFLLPAQAVVSRSIDISAPPEKVFAIVGDLRRFRDFSPWADLDPDIKYTFEGPESGVGQTMKWSSDNTDVGSGSQTIVKFEPSDFVESQLAFGMRGKSTASFDLVPSTTGTKVTWTFNSNLEGIPAKWFGLMFDRWIGADYEKGLAKLKMVAETPEPTAPEPIAPSASEPVAPEQPAQQ
ncbi:MAG: SRPBCC family protein [Hyphomicrobiales bacterium]|nr:SRPBCC family protein [Hyphomicrobiales bacterium]